MAEQDKKRNKNITLNVITGSTLKSMAVKYGITSERVKQITARVLYKTNKELYNICDTQEPLRAGRRMRISISIKKARKMSEFIIPKIYNRYNRENA